MAKELLIIDRSYRLSVWLHEHVRKFPRNSRFSLGSRLEERLLNVLELLIDAKFSKVKEQKLREAAIQLEQFRFLLRMCKDLHFIALKSHEFAVAEIVEINRQLLAWRQYSEAKAL